MFGLMKRYKRAKADGSRGAVLVEFVLIAPVFAIIVAGVLELGLAFRDSMTVSNALRAGARVGSNAGRERLADYTILKSIEAAMAEVPTARINKIIIYKATSTASTPSAACMALAAPTGSSPVGYSSATNGYCNVYGPSSLSLTTSSFTGSTCTSTQPDYYWCPTSRQNQQALGADYLGVWMSVTYTYITKVFPGTGITIKDRAVMRLEPRLT
jgi:Flp pilus assembly protein TadG